MTFRRGEGCVQFGFCGRHDDTADLAPLLRDRVRSKNEIVGLTAKDHRTHELSLAILNEEVEHESWFSEFLGEGPSGHGGVRRESGHSPHVSRFMP